MDTCGFYTLLQKEADTKRKLKLPIIHIVNKGSLTKVCVDGKELRGTTSVEFSHSIHQNKAFPIVKIGLQAEKVCIDTAQVFALPEIYHPFYVSVDKLVKAGVLTYEELNRLLENGSL